MNALMSSCPRRGSCKEYCRSSLGGKFVNDSEITGGTPELREPSAYDGFILLFLRHGDLLLIVFVRQGADVTYAITGKTADPVSILLNNPEHHR